MWFFQFDVVSDFSFRYFLLSDLQYSWFGFKTDTAPHDSLPSRSTRERIQVCNLLLLSYYLYVLIIITYVTHHFNIEQHSGIKNRLNDVTYQDLVDVQLVRYDHATGSSFNSGGRHHFLQFFVLKRFTVVFECRLDALATDRASSIRVQSPECA